VPPGIEKLH